MTKGYTTYKGYIIKPTIVCFDIRYFVYGEGFVHDCYKDITEAQNAIDKYIAKSYLHKMLNSISDKINVSEEIVIESFKDIILND